MGIRKRNLMVISFILSLLLVIPIIYAGHSITSVSIRVPTSAVSISNGNTFNFGCDIAVTGSGAPDKNVVLHYDYCEADATYTCTGAWGDIPTTGSTSLVISANNPVSVGNLNSNYQDPNHTTTGYSSPSNYYKIRCWAQGDADGSPVYSGTQNVEVATADETPPQWSSPDANVTNPHRGEPVNISVVWEDTGSGSDWAWLSTNETGSWENYTDGTYGSPRDLGDTTSPITVNFTWTNQTGSPRVIGWIIYANDTSGNENGTDNPSGAYEGSFTMWGWSNITWSSTDASANVGDTVKLVCFVNDTNTTGSGPINGYDIYFYNETASASSFLGTNYTNSTGHAVWHWDTTGLSAGEYYPKCNITDNSTLYYNASEYYQANTTISVQNFVELSFSQALIGGIIFGEVTPNTVGNPARNNTSGESSGTEYNVTVGSSSTNNIDFYVKLNETFEAGIDINETSSTTSASSGFSTNTTVDASWSILGNATLNCTNIAIGNNCWFRLYFDVGNVPSGYKQRNYTICGVVTGSNPSICG